MRSAPESGQLVSDFAGRQAEIGAEARLESFRPELPQPDLRAPAQAQFAAAEPPRTSKMAAIVVALSVLAIVGLSLWYLVLPQPLLVQGEADATRVDIAARIEGRVGQRPVERSDNVTAGQLLVAIDNPELLTKLREAEAARAVAQADLARIEVGTRAEVIEERKAAVAAADANVTLAQQTYDRIKQITQGGYESVAKLDEATASLDVATRTRQQAKSAYQEAVAGYTVEERGVAQAAVAKAEAAITTLQAQVNEMTVKAPIAGQVYQVGAELGEYVSPGVPLLSLVDLGDVWLRFDLREDLVKGLKVGDRFRVRIPALGDLQIPVEVRTIATRGEYAGWRATRATGDFDLRTFEVRAYPVDKIPNLRPGMSAYADWNGAR
ncbi:efflux RND transporter periplasmic adaptor subunit [Mesorhizobium sp. BAC0120]|uniref:HlyD family secretion protein n=1 Tax=Mesorhizobium sp. BAC0120 TaxID=3090670 RepID=UPI00298C7CAA|nr:efflux RND transporter periplasmic adaptor subunit [Mesorhizobium sp. BAC0120]MDW6023402.1 efflux RND transporter periplasmic adaptor subunit [Mesorhizobium sp. BAC0120]